MKVVSSIEASDPPPSEGTTSKECPPEESQGLGAMARFSCATAAYRIIRLSVEMFLVEYTTSMGRPAAVAGLVFLAYSLADVSAALVSFWRPLLWFGSLRRAVGFLAFCVVSMTAGAIGIFHTASVPIMALSSVVCGCGTATWFVHYQTLTNKAFASSCTSRLAQMRQVFECLGFLLPSVVLAVVNVREGSSFVQIVRVSVSALGVLGLAFFLVSSSQIIRVSANFNPSDGQAQSVKEAIKTFASSHVINYFILDALVLAMANILFGTLSVITDRYFGLESAYLWLAAIAVPIGGAFSAVCGMKGWFTHNDDRRAVLNGTTTLASILVAMVFAGPWAGSLSARASKALMFSFGLLVGFFYSKTYTSAFALWLHKLRQEPRDFIARANVLHNIGVQVLMASLFQAQTVLVDLMLQNDFHPMIDALILFGPLCLLNIGAHLLAHSIPYASDSLFGWPVPTPFTFMARMTIKLISSLTSYSMDHACFAVFSDYRTSLFARYLSKDTTIRGGPSIEPGTILSPENLRLHLQQFDDIGSEEQWWDSSASLNCVLMSNSSSFDKRLELIDGATSSICISAWSLDGVAGRLVVERLIARSREGVDVRVIVDAVNLYYLSQMHQMKKSADAQSIFGLLSKLIKSKVKVGMLDSWHNCDTKRPYLIGTHRKIMLVDNKWLLTGGRNIEDSYAWDEAKEEHFKFYDTDVLLRGDFSSTTAALFDSLWAKSRAVDKVCASTKARGQSPDPIVPSSWAFTGALDEIDRSTSLFTTSRSIEDSLHDDAAVGESLKLDDTFTTGSGTRRSIYRVNNSFCRTASSFTFEMQALNDVTSGGVSLFQLDHKAGRADGNDIVLSTILFLITTARSSVDITFGYFHLFPVIEDALEKALARGVEVRVFTNSEESNDLSFCNNVFQKSFCRLLEMGVKVYVPTSAEKKCIHTKGILVDSRAFLLGSWNAMGMSVFYDEEYSVLLLADEEENSLFRPVQSFYDDVISGEFFTEMTRPPRQFAYPLVISIIEPFLFSKYGRRTFEIGY